MKFCFFLLLLTFTSQAQYNIAGVVTDSDTHSPIPFATIRTESKPTIITDLAGRFSIPADGLESLTISHVDYENRFLRINPTNFVNISLSRRSDASLDDAQASSIMQTVARLKTQNDLNPAESLNFKSYSRLVITANPDSIDGRIDTIIRKRKRNKIKIDSSDYQFKKIIEKQHLFQTEKISEHEYSDGKMFENVIATKMAGFEEPVYEVYSFQLMSPSVYDEPLVIFESEYRNPLSDEAPEYYKYRLLDTIAYNGRDTYVIHFESLKPNRQSALRGVFFIDNSNFAVAKATISVKGKIDITAEHAYRYSDTTRKYLSENLSVRVVKGENEDEIRILGETLSLAATPIDAGSRRYASDFAYLLSETAYSDYAPGEMTTAKKRGVSVIIPDSALEKDDNFWNAHRPQLLDARSLNTYAALDSIAQRVGVEKKLLLGRKVINGYLPLGFFDVDLRYLISFNNYEGFRLGFGGKTNNQFSEKYRIFGYTAYGTKDGKFKYQVGSSARIDKNSDTWFGFSYTDDIREIASTNFAIDKRTFKIYDPRPINVSTFYNYVAWRAYVETKTIPGTESIWQVTHNLIRPQFGYSYLHNGQQYRNFSLSAAMLSIQWNPFSDYMQTPSGRIETVKRFPKFTFQLTQALPNILGNDLEFGKIEIRTIIEKKFLNQHKISALFEAGQAYGEVPITHAYNTSPNNLDKDRLLQRITFAGKDSFETMYFNEFFSDRFVFMQYKYAFGRMMISDKIKPTPVLATRMVWGNMDNRGRHQGIDFKTLEHGYYESGIEFNGIFKGLGLSAFYRYGANHLPDLEDNIAIKLSFVINIGF